MLYHIYKNAILALICSLFFVNCTGEVEPLTKPTLKPMQVDTSANSQDRAEPLPFKNKTQNKELKDIFMKIPNENWQTAAFKNIDKNIKQQLLDNQLVTPFAVETDRHTLQLKELFQSNDDDKEQQNVAEIAVFTYKNEQKWLVFMAEKLISKNKPDAPRLIKQSFWDFDGKIWVDVTKSIPTISESMFFDSPILSNSKSENILLNSNSKKPDILIANVPEKYSNQDVQHHIQLEWDGEKFELFIK